MEEWESERKIRTARTLQRFPDLKCKFESGQMNPTLLELALGVAHREKLSNSDLEGVSVLSAAKAAKQPKERLLLSILNLTNSQKTESGPCPKNFQWYNLLPLAVYLGS